MGINPKIIYQMLIGIGLVKPDEVKKALEMQRNARDPISAILKKKGYIKDEDILHIVTEQLNLKPESTENAIIDPDVLKIVPSNMAFRHRIIPIEVKGKTLTLATDNPFNFLAFDNFKKFLGYDISGILTSKSDILRLLEKYYEQTDDAPINVLVAGLDKGEEKRPKRALYPEAEDNKPVVKLVSLLIAEAVRRRASDIHVEPFEDKVRIRYRIDGVLLEVPAPPKKLQASVISRIKIMAGMDIAEKRLPQDGRISIDVNGRQLDLRVSTLPSHFGESVVMRILDKTSYMLNLKDLGFFSRHEKVYEKLIKLPNGILLVTGPTGSGKTTTLYASLNYINKPDRKLITVEEPVEYQISGVNQVNVRPQIDLTFAAGLRSILRQAPDVIMIGEIRDLETAQIAIQASLTGHLVFSTLHTNDAPGAITRLADMGIKPYLIASALQGILAQRLVRVICQNCKTPYKPSPDELASIEIQEYTKKEVTCYRGAGCEECHNTGFKGRTGIFELLIIDDKIRELIYENPPSSIIKREAKAMGMDTLKDDGIKKAFEGITTISEVFRVTQQDVS